MQHVDRVIIFIIIRFNWTNVKREILEELTRANHLQQGVPTLFHFIVVILLSNNCCFWREPHSIYLHRSNQ